ncbi:hypothetical protein AB0E67_27510 [Streptomyces sp. NPDC032161]|uniref:hypothetical protein n=1 Tax=unclassified Streptomyces TaxID=2593676 RepID=UPI0033EABB97
MSDKTAVNDELPDQDALAAFAGAALGGGRRRRRNRDGQESQQPKPDTAAVEEAEAQRDEQEEQPTPVPEPVREDVPAPTPATASTADAGAVPVTVDRAELPKLSVPAPAASVEQPVAPAPEAETPAVPVPEPTGNRVPDNQVAVRQSPTAAPFAPRSLPTPYQSAVRDISEVQVPNLGPSGARATQCTIMVSQSVRDRFAHYQLSKKMAGEKEPANALVVRRAFLYCKRNDLFGKLLADVYQQNNAVDDEDYDEDGMLGEVVGRRAVRGRLKDSGQQSFRPSEQELANYDAFTQAYGFPSRSDFLSAVLGEFLPQLPSSGRRR